MKRVSIVLALAAVLLSASGCGDDRFEADVSKSNLKLTVNRLDRDLFVGTAASADSLNAALVEKYGLFYRLYLEDIIRVGSPDNPMISVGLNEFRNNPAIREIQQHIAEVFSDFSPYNQQLEEAFKRYRYFFPQAVIPEIVTYNGGFNYGIYPTDSTLGIGLEWYLGPDNEVVGRLAPEIFPQYKRDNMAPKYLGIDAVKGWLMVSNAGLLEDNLLSSMIFHGKILFVCSKLFPEQPIADVLSFSEKQLDWCRKNEFFIWSHLVENELIYSKSNSEIAKLINDGPFTPGMPPESPGGVGKWVGLQMVSAYVDKHPEVSLLDLLKKQDPTIYLKSYKPAQ